MTGERSTEDAPVARRTGLWLAGLCVLALAVRLATVFLLDGNVHSGDAYEYLGIANSIATGRGFALGRAWFDGGSAYDDPVPTAWREPGYALLVAGVQLIARDAVVPAVKILHAVLGSVSCLLVFLAARAVFGARAGLYAAAGLAVYPPFLFYTRDVGTESLFVTMLLAVWAVALCGQGCASVHRAGALGALVGATCLVRSMGAVLLPPLLLQEILTRRSCRLWHVHSAVMLLGFAIVVAPWLLRNYPLSGGRLVLASRGYQALWLPVHRWVTSPHTEKHHASHTRINLLAREGDDVLLSELTEWQREDYFKSVWLDHIRTRPGTYCRICLANAAHLWKLTPDRDYYRLSLRVVAGSCSVLLLALAATGAGAGRRGTGAVGILLVYLALITLAHMPLPTVLRFRVAHVDPVLILLAGAGAEYLLTRFRRPYRGPGRTRPCLSHSRRAHSPRA
jgi:4-amino-4-deoxy-L-arabinose transferase-like glycosyltransferase